MKLIDINCPNCGSAMKADADRKNVVCEYCGASFMIDYEVQHVRYDNAEDAGYQFEKGRQRAQAEAMSSRVVVTSSSQSYKPPKKRRTWLWVLGWIFCFPIPLTILILRNKKISAPIRWGLVAALWIAILYIGSSNSSSSSTDTGNTKNTKTSSIATEGIYLAYQEEDWPYASIIDRRF